MISRTDPKTLTALVTGATAGFGEAICRRFAAEGAKVIATGRRGERLEKLRKELGARCHAAAFDVRDRKAVDQAFAALPPSFNKPNVIVANAGLALGVEPAYKADPSNWETMVATNVNGVLNIVHAALPGMVERDEGHVVVIGSVAGEHPYPGGNVYGASKAFVKHFAMNLRADLLGTHVRVTNIEPGLAETEFSLVRFQGDAAKAKQPYEGMRPLSAEDIAETVFWACTLPKHVNINNLQVMPIMQGFGAFAVHRSTTR